MTLMELMAKKYGGKTGAIIGEGYFTPAGSSLIKAKPGTEWMSSIFWMWATHAAEVEVDTETGVVKGTMGGYPKMRRSVARSLSVSVIR